MKIILVILLLATATIFAAEPSRPRLVLQRQVPGTNVLAFEMHHPAGAVQIQRWTNEKKDVRVTVVPMLQARFKMVGQPEMVTWTDTNIVSGTRYAYTIRWLHDTQISAWSEKLNTTAQ